MRAKLLSLMWTLSALSEALAASLYCGIGAQQQQGVSSSSSSELAAVDFAFWYAMGLSSPLSLQSMWNVERLIYDAIDDSIAWCTTAAYTSTSMVALTPGLVDERQTATECPVARIPLLQELVTGTTATNTVDCAVVRGSMRILARTPDDLSFTIAALQVSLEAAMLGGLGQNGEVADVTFLSYLGDSEDEALGNNGGSNGGGEVVVGGTGGGSETETESDNEDNETGDNNGGSGTDGGGVGGSEQETSTDNEDNETGGNDGDSEEDGGGIGGSEQETSTDNEDNETGGNDGDSEEGGIGGSEQETSADDEFSETGGNDEDSATDEIENDDGFSGNGQAGGDNGSETEDGVDGEAGSDGDQSDRDIIVGDPSPATAPEKEEAAYNDDGKLGLIIGIGIPVFIALLGAAFLTKKRKIIAASVFSLERDHNATIVGTADPPDAFHFGLYHYMPSGRHYLSTRCSKCRETHLSQFELVDGSDNGEDMFSTQASFGEGRMKTIPEEDSYGGSSSPLSNQAESSLSLGRYHTGIDVHHCTSATCDACNDDQQGQNRTVFVPSPKSNVIASPESCSSIFSFLTRTKEEDEASGDSDDGSPLTYLGMGEV